MGQSKPLMIAGAFIIGWAGAGGLLQIATSVCNMLFPKIKGTVTALVMIASSLCNYTILTAASKMQPSQVMVMNMAVWRVRNQITVAERHCSFMLCAYCLFI